MDATQMTDGAQLARLAWECEHFGFPVARLEGRGRADSALWCGLAAARREGLHLVVLTTETGRELPAELLTEFCGGLMDRKATFARSLLTVPADEPACENLAEEITEYHESTVSPYLLDLAISSGVYSRFRVDPCFPHVVFADMYRTWIERSVRHEIADVVLVASDSGCPGGLSGFVTIGRDHGVAKIGLIAVADQARGRGVGRRLMTAAHRWMRDHGAESAQVVTQLANAPACGLYRRCRYRLSALEHYYHMWPLTRAGER
ncbi:MAG TPA: GNAT family N-acetyltransferase [Pirellulales bacterium]|jgi:dTDP-4-amino-4,6-dideoxy-D-galactose acyltransferase